MNKKSKPFKYWNYNTCYDEARKYETLLDFRKNAGSTYSTAWKNGWLDDYTWLKKYQYTKKS